MFESDLIEVLGINIGDEIQEPGSVLRSPAFR
jgi:hypothetical protein